MPRAKQHASILLPCEMVTVGNEILQGILHTLSPGLRHSTAAAACKLLHKSGMTNDQYQNQRLKEASPMDGMQDEMHQMGGCRARQPLSMIRSS